MTLDGDGGDTVALDRVIPSLTNQIEPVILKVTNQVSAFDRHQTSTASASVRAAWATGISFPLSRYARTISWRASSSMARQSSRSEPSVITSGHSMSSPMYPESILVKRAVKVAIMKTPGYYYTAVFKR
jgi:hypothetical protein